MALMAKAYTPLALVDCREFRKLISSLDPRIVPVSRSRLSIKLIPLNYDAVESDVIKVLNNSPYAVLSFDMWISVKNEDIFSISAHHYTELKKGHHHLGMPSTKVIDTNNLSDSIVEIITKFNL